MAKRQIDPSLRCLTSKFIEKMIKLGWPTPTEFKDFFRKEARLKGPVERDYGLMRRGGKVGEALVQGIVEYVKSRHSDADIPSGDTIKKGADITVEDVSVVDRRPHDLNGRWKSWPFLYDLLGEPFRAVPQMFVADPDRDLPELATWIAQCAGYKCAPPGESLERDDCQERGILLMGRSVDAYASQLRGWWERNPHTVMYAVERAESGTIERVCGSVVLPLLESRAEKLCQGKIWDIDLDGDDIDVGSEIIFIDAVAERFDLNGKRVDEVTAAQVHCVMNQVAYFASKTKSGRPKMLVPAINRDMEKRFILQGYRRVGVFGKNMAMFGMDSPERVKKPTLKNRKDYGLFMLSLGFYTNANAQDWEREAAAQ